MVTPSCLPSSFGFSCKYGLSSVRRYSRLARRRSGTVSTVVRRSCRPSLTRSFTLGMMRTRSCASRHAPRLSLHAVHASDFVVRRRFVLARAAMLLPRTVSTFVHGGFQRVAKKFQKKLQSLALPLSYSTKGGTLNKAPPLVDLFFEIRVSLIRRFLRSIRFKMEVPMGIEPMT